LEHSDLASSRISPISSALARSSFDTIASRTRTGVAVDGSTGGGPAGAAAGAAGGAARPSWSSPPLLAAEGGAAAARRSFPSGEMEVLPSTPAARSSSSIESGMGA